MIHSATPHSNRISRSGLSSTYDRWRVGKVNKRQPSSGKRLKRPTDTLNENQMEYLLADSQDTLITRTN